VDKLSTLWAPLVPYARALMDNARQCYVTSGYRSYADQKRLRDQWDALRARGLTSQQIAEQYGLYTPSKPGQSMHNYGLAFDVGGPAEERAWLGAIWNSWGGQWSTRDHVHFQVRLSG